MKSFNTNAAAQRTHDSLYMQEDRSATPKEYFKLAAQLTEKDFGGSLHGKSALDVGCASGDFLFYLNQRFPGLALNGMDVVPALAQTAQKKVPTATVHQGDINAARFDAIGTYDVVYMFGVHSIFDECEHWTRNIFNLLNPKGKAYIFGIFNPMPYDVLVRVRPAGEKTDYESGWNCFSIATIQQAFEHLGATMDSLRWNVPLDIAYNEGDALRSWTTPMADGTRLVTNATRIIHDFYMLTVSRD